MGERPVQVAAHDPLASDRLLADGAHHLAYVEAGAPRPAPGHDDARVGYLQPPLDDVSGPVPRLRELVHHLDLEGVLQRLTRQPLQPARVELLYQSLHVLLHLLQGPADPPLLPDADVELIEGVGEALEGEELVYEAADGVEKVVAGVGAVVLDDPVEDGLRLLGADAVLVDDAGPQTPLLDDDVGVILALLSVALGAVAAEVGPGDEVEVPGQVEAEDVLPRPEGLGLPHRRLWDGPVVARGG